MSDASPSELLERQHRDIDAGIQAVAEGGGDLRALGASLDLLRLHLYIEEDILFPPLERSGLTMPVFVMQREHGQMWLLLEQLAAACGAGADPAALKGDCAELLHLLQVHNPKEEQILYTAADRLAAQAGDGTLASDIGQAGLPGGWACRMAPKG
ncbi:hypothetical protein GCM10022279_02670 [Comamonas faecalis]|uniref:Hemerythrin-like domain-containing protein n=1 Tax=Comamonas faecalis TaxID=1387849 RepID=A0ABP7QHD8_9BURK